MAGKRAVIRTIAIYSVYVANAKPRQCERFEVLLATSCARNVAWLKLSLSNCMRVKPFIGPFNQMNDYFINTIQTTMLSPD